MAHQSNQHYVPKYYFRFFNNGTECINVFVRARAKLVTQASIRHQCSAHRFYGSPELEKKFMKWDDLHRSVLWKFIQNANRTTQSWITAEDHRQLCKAILFQRFRTMYEAERRYKFDIELNQQIYDEITRQHQGISDEVRAEMFALIKSGYTSGTETRQRSVLSSIDVGVSSSSAILDLAIRIICNRTSIPFIFSDSPVVLINTYYQNIKWPKGIVPRLSYFEAVIVTSPDCKSIRFDSRGSRLTEAISQARQPVAQANVTRAKSILSIIRPLRALRRDVCNNSRISPSVKNRLADLMFCSKQAQYAQLQALPD